MTEKERERQRKWRAANREKVRRYQRAYRERHREHVRRLTRKQTRRWALKNKYGLTPEQYTALLTSQGNRCALCRITDPGKFDWRVDHCHRTTRVRGLLCHNCNVALGHVGDDPVVLKRMIAYLEGDL